MSGSTLLGKRKRPRLTVVGSATGAAEATPSLLLCRSPISPPSASSSLQRLASSPFAHSSAVHPLTETNLARLNRCRSCDSARPLKGPMPRSPVRSRPPSPSKDNVRLQLLRLRAHGILDVERGLADAPVALRELAESITTRRDPSVPPSARKERILDVSAAAGLKKENDGLDALKKQLFLDPVISHGDDMLIDLAVDSNYVRGFIPPALGSTVSGDVKELETPRPGKLTPPSIPSIALTLPALNHTTLHYTLSRRWQLTVTRHHRHHLWLHLRRHREKASQAYRSSALHRRGRDGIP